MRHIVSLLLLIGLSNCVSAQNQTIDLADFFGKKWVTSIYEIHGKKHPATDILEGDGTIFLADGTFSSIDKGVSSSGTWTYDAASRALTAQTIGYDEPNRLKILSLDPAVAIMQTVHVGEDNDKHHDHAMTIYLEVRK